jgi:hypothetical protein
MRMRGEVDLLAKQQLAVEVMQGDDRRRIAAVE